MSATGFARKLKLVLTAAALGSCIGLAGAHAAARLLSTGGCLTDGANFVSANGGCTDTHTGQTWSPSYLESHASAVTYDQAVSSCAALVEDGYDDWHLPSVTELNSMASDGGANYLQLASPSNPLWSSTTQGNKAWAVWPDTDRTSYFLKGSALDFVCVRPTPVTGKGK